MSLIPAQTIGDLLDSDWDEYATAKTWYDAQGLGWNKTPRRMDMEDNKARGEIIDLSARGEKPAAIAARLGLDVKQVGNTRFRYKGAIDARRKELAGQNLDGTPATIAHKPVAEPTAEAPTEPLQAPDKPGVAIRAVELDGAFAGYCLMADRVEFLDGAIDSIAFDKLPALVADLQEILAMTESVVVWKAVKV